MSRSRAAAIVQAVHGSPHAGPGSSSGRYNVSQQPPPPPAGMPPASAYGLGHGYGDDGYGHGHMGGGAGAVTDPVIAAALAKADFAVQQATVTAQRAAEGAAAAYSMMRR